VRVIARAWQAGGLRLERAPRPDMAVMPLTSGLLAGPPALVTRPGRPKGDTIRGVTILSPNSAKMHLVMTR
jgi:hypothetical protein